MKVKQDKQVHPLRTITQEKLDRILHDIKNYAPIKYATVANGCCEEHFHTMVKQGIDDLKHDKPDTIHARLAKSLRKIQMEEVVSCLKDIRKAKKGHKGAEWTLEHSYWRTFCADAKLIELAEEIQQAKGNDNVIDKRK